MLLLAASAGAMTLANAGCTMARDGARPAPTTTDAGTIRTEILAEGLDHPWGLDFLPDGAAIVTERSGTLRIFSGGALSEPVDGVPEVAARGQGGLLDVAVHPDHDENGLVFLSFAEGGDGGAGTAVARGRLVREAGSVRLEEVKTIFSMALKTGAGQHFGSRLVFAPDGTLFVTTGDRGNGKRSQDPMDHAGAVLRINDDGSIPSGNAFDDPGKGKPEIWSKGHRNIQAATIDPLTETLLTVEHGARGGDELNRPEVGKNYGWPVITYGVDYSGDKIGIGTEAPGYEQPLHYWDPSIAPSGMDIYRGDMFPEWKDDLLVGSLKFQLLSRLERNDQGEILGEERLFDGEFGRIRDVDVAPDGSVWLITDADDGAIVRLSRGG